MLCEKATQWREGILYENKSHKKIQEFKGQEIKCEYLWKYRCQGNFHAQPLWWNFTTWKLEQDWSALNTKWYFQRFLCQQQKTLPDIFQIYIAMHDSAKINQNTSLTPQKKLFYTNQWSNYIVTIAHWLQDIDMNWLRQGFNHIFLIKRILWIIN